MKEFQPSNESKHKKASLLKTLLTGALIFVHTSDSAQSNFQKDTEKSISQTETAVKNWTKNSVNSINKAINTVDLPENFTFDGTHRLWAKDENGDVYLDWSVIIAPVQIEVGYEHGKDNKALFKVPYRYSRGFNTAEATNKEQQKEAVQYIIQKLKEEFAEKLIFWDPTNSTRDVYNYKHDGEVPDLSKVKIKGISITGLSSPEGPEEKGKSTLVPGAVDPENISLAEKRGSDMDPEIRTALTSLGISPDVISKIDGKEVQFTEVEMTKLDSLAKASGINDAVDSLEAAFILVREYNSGNIKDASVKAELDKIMNGKRMVEVEITYEEGKKTKHVIPIPFILLFSIPGIRWLRRKTVRERFERTPTDDDDLLSERSLDSKINENHPRFIELYDMAAESVEAKRDKAYIAERLIVDEFNPYLGTKKDDVGYMNMVEGAGSIDWDLYNAHNVFGDRITSGNESEEERTQRLERRITLTLLRRWEMNDIHVRARKGVMTSDELNYWQEPQKIIWAQEAMRNIRRYAQIYDEERNTGNPRAEEAVYKALADDVKALREQDRLVSKRKKIRTVRVPESEIKGYRGPHNGKYR